MQLSAFMKQWDGELRQCRVCAATTLDTANWGTFDRRIEALDERATILKRQADLWLEEPPIGQDELERRIAALESDLHDTIVRYGLMSSLTNNAPHAGLHMRASADI